MRITKKILLAALLPLLAMLLGALFAPTPPTETTLVVAADPILPAITAQSPAGLLSNAWDQARGLWMAAWGVTASC